MSLVLMRELMTQHRVEVHMHPVEVVYLEHDGKVLLVDEQGRGPQRPVQGRTDSQDGLRFPTRKELQKLAIEFEEKGTVVLRYGESQYRVAKGYPRLDWPKDWAWKDRCASDNAVHPVARDAIYRSIHRLVAKVMVCNDDGEVLMGRVERGHFRGSGPSRRVHGPRRTSGCWMRSGNPRRTWIDHCARQHRTCNHATRV